MKIPNGKAVMLLLDTSTDANCLKFALSHNGGGNTRMPIPCSTKCPDDAERAKVPVDRTNAAAPPTITSGGGQSQSGESSKEHVVNREHLWG